MSDFSGHAASFWDERYRREGSVYGTAPTPFLAAQRDRLRPGMRALVPGDGEGRNGVWLAEQGLEVVTVDLSAEGVRKARALAAERGVTTTALQTDLTTWNWPVAEFDLVVSVFLHLPPATRTAIHRAMVDALKPGGLLILEAFRPEQVEHREKFGAVGGPPGVEMLFSEAMLRADFAEMEVLELRSTDEELGDQGAHRGRGAVVRGVWRKPGSDARRDT